MARYLADTNILLRFVDREASEHVLVNHAVSTLLAQGDEVVLASQTLYEFWAVATRPVKVNGFGWETLRARQETEGLLENFPLLPETASVFTHWLELVTTHNVQGKQVHDTRLVAIMQAHGLEWLLTLNAKDFTRFPVKAVHPDEVGV